MDPLPIFIDLEASSLSNASYPIEVAWNAPDGTIEAYLISPAHIPHWTDWSAKAEQLHGISRAALRTSGKPPSWICRRMNHQFAGTVVYSDESDYDGMWLAALFAVSSCGGPAFTLVERFVNSLQVISVSAPLHRLQLDGLTSTAWQN